MTKKFELGPESEVRVVSLTTGEEVDNPDIAAKAEREFDAAIDEAQQPDSTTETTSTELPDNVIPLFPRRQ